ncbi:MAG TPA: branched-chain amino acid ABC transporter permease [Amycolatopsis sp.]|nr:branched-chain amino acid ABC transporter permease [Amycolatopsis sp.]
MTLLIQRLLDGLSGGAVYAALALAIVLVFRSTGTLNLAQGEMAMFTCFLAWKLSTGLGWPVVPAIVVAMAAGFAGGALIERVVVRPVEDRPDHLPIIIVTLGLMLAINALAGGLFTVDIVRLPDVFPAGALQLGGVHLAYSTIGLLAVLLVVSALIWALFQRTRIGLHMRASVDSPESARLVGIRRSHMLMLGWGIAGALGALAAVLVAPQTFVHTGMLQGVLLYAFAAATLGGFTSVLGAVVGGLIVGVLQSLAVGYIDFIGNDLSLLVALAIIIAVLMVKPNGLFGRADSSRL